MKGSEEKMEAAVMERTYDNRSSSFTYIKREYIHNNNKTINQTINRGEIWWAELKGEGKVQRGLRPYLILQNQSGNLFAPTVIGVPLTSDSNNKRDLPTHVFISKDEGLGKDSIVLGEQIQTIDKSQLKTKITTLSDQVMKMVNTAILTSLALG
jgi:mRNA interferase MazF